MRRFVLVLVVLAAAAAATLLPARAAFALSWRGTVEHVADGDTIDVNVDGDGKGRVRIRLIGLNAMEINDPRTTADDDCHATEAHRRMRALVLGKRVTLWSRYASSSSLGRPLRHVWQSDLGDVGSALLREGHAVPQPHHVERSKNDRYLALAKDAAARRVGIWDRDFCASGPRQSTPIRLSVNWDAAGDDSKNVNGEWVRLYNGGTSALPIGGWKVRDSSARSYTFPSWASVPAGGRVTLYVGYGSNSRTSFHWDLSRPVFDNVEGDVAYLLDLDGDVRAWRIYTV